MVGDDEPPVSCATNDLAQTETQKIVEENQRSENSCVSQVELAAAWLSRNRDTAPSPILPFLRRNFDLTSLQAIEAAKLAHALEYSRAAQ